jgi:hypothetical protein
MTTLAATRTRNSRPVTLTLADVRRQYGLHGEMVRRMIEFGYETENGTIRKLDAKRVRGHWAVKRASLDRWAAETDRATLEGATDYIGRNGFLQLGWGATEETRRSYDRLAAGGRLRHEAIKCKDTGHVWDTYFLPK